MENLVYAWITQINGGVQTKSLKITKQIRELKRNSGLKLGLIVTIELAEAIYEIKELLRICPRFIIAGNAFEIEVDRRTYNIILHKEDPWPNNSAANETYQLMYRALNQDALNWAKDTRGNLKTEEIYNLHKFLDSSKIKFQTS